MEIQLYEKFSEALFNHRFYVSEIKLQIMDMEFNQ